MGGDVEEIKERLDIVDIATPYIKLEKADAHLKGRCPFHNEKTPSFFISPVRQSFYCFGCGAKGDVFTLVQEVEGLDFREALKFLAAKAGVELKGQTREDAEHRSERDRLYAVLDEAASFYHSELEKFPEALLYLRSRGISAESVEEWRIGYAQDEWRFLYSHLVNLGFPKEIVLRAGLAKHAPGKEGKEPYDVFRGRIVFPLSDPSGRIVAFSGRALSGELEPKYLNSPDTVLFTKSELLYGLDKAKEDIRKKDYAVMVEGQIDLVLSHQAGVSNTVASSGTAFTSAHLDRLKKLSPRIILAFDGDSAGEKAALKSAVLAMSLGMEVKIASMPAGKDPADVIVSGPEEWKDVLRKSLPAVEHFLNLIVERETDSRKRGLLVKKDILPLILLLESSIERSHFVSLVSKKIGIREEVVWDDLRLAKKPDASSSYVGASATQVNDEERGRLAKRPRKELVEERLAELASWRKEMAGQSDEIELIDKEETELRRYLSKEALSEELALLTRELARAEATKDDAEIASLSKKVRDVHARMQVLEEGGKMM